MDYKPYLASARSAMQETKAEARILWRQAAVLLRRYADWLSLQSWKRLAVLALLSTIVVAMLSQIPPFSASWGPDRTIVHPPKRAAKSAAKKSSAAATGSSVEVQVDDNGVRVVPHPPAAPSTPGAPATAASGEPGASVTVIPLPPGVTPPSIDIKLPPGADKEEVRQAVEDARDQIVSAIEEAKADAEAEIEAPRVEVVRGWRPADSMMPLLMVVIVGSIIVKVMGTGRRKAEAQAAVATERAESESLKRQVVEARMAAMQAQVEPHFLFNTLASIDHLIETDPARASQMQKNLIALLRASMPTMRETKATGLRELGREVAVIRPYLEILKVRMEERLQYEIDVPEGLMSAEFPPMMVQGLVENAIKHGLEPKAEGGRLAVKAEVRHGKLCVTVADTGLGFGKAATSGTGVGLANIRERLQLLYGPKGTITVTENQPSGTVVTITVPYTHRPEEGA